MIAPVFLLCLSCLAADADTPPAYVLETRDAQRVAAILTYDFHFPRFQAKEWILYAGRLPELPAQVQVNSRMEPRGETVQELSPLHQSVLRARVVGPEFVKGVPMTVAYQAMLRSRDLRPLRAGENPPVV